MNTGDLGSCYLNIYGQTDRQTDKRTDRQTHKRTNAQTKRQIDRRMDGQTDMIQGFCAFYSEKVRIEFGNNFKFFFTQLCS